MVAQKINCPRRSDDIANQCTKSNYQTYGFFANESKDSQYFETDRSRTYKERKEPAGERSNRRGYRGNLTRNFTRPSHGIHQLFRGKSGSTDVNLKPEPEFEETTMYRTTDCEFFQELDLWSCAPAKDEPVQTIDSLTPTEEIAKNTNTLHTQICPIGWETLDVNSPSAHTSLYCGTPQEALSPNFEAFMPIDNQFIYPDISDAKKSQEQFLDISSLPVVIGELTSDKLNTDQPFGSGWDTHNIHTDYTETNKMPFIDHDDSLDLKLGAVVRPADVGWNDEVISEFIVNEESGSTKKVEDHRSGGGLSLDVARASLWQVDPIISTPEVLSYVEQLEKQDSPCFCTNSSGLQWPSPEESSPFIDLESPKTNSSTNEYLAVTPESEFHIESDDDGVTSLKSHNSRKRRHESEDSDETYTPYAEKHTPRKYIRRKASVPIKEMIQALEEAQPVTKTRRGRPPKRRDSNFSSVCSDQSAPTQEGKYRVIRDKNNEASKRSRMNRKLKELQMEQLAIELEERNKKLQVKADILDDMTKRLKDALMSAILKT